MGNFESREREEDGAYPVCPKCPSCKYSYFIGAVVLGGFIGLGLLITKDLNRIVEKLECIETTNKSILESLTRIEYTTGRF